MYAAGKVMIFIFSIIFSFNEPMFDAGNKSPSLSVFNIEIDVVQQTAEYRYSMGTWRPWVAWLVSLRDQYYEW